VAARGALAVAGVAFGLGVFAVAGAFTIQGESAYAGVGPRAVPLLVGGALTLAGLAFGASVLRGATFPASEPPADRRALALVLAGLAAAIAGMTALGFPIAATLVFMATARAFGSRRLVIDVLIGLALGIVVYVAFARGLGVSLPGFEVWSPGR
jgi:putative tricarboxylic transport membrane protein